MNKVPVLLAASAAALALTVAGCGGSGDPASNSTSSAANSTLEQAVKFTQCMRENGVANWPDPEKDGTFVIGAGGPDQSSSQFKKAQQACKSMEPPGFHKTGAEQQAETQRNQQEWLKAAQCMRQNGVPNFPDPQDGRLKIDRNKIDVNSPQFKKARNACRDELGGSNNGNG